MTTLLLIRHGESEANRKGIFAGQVDPDLQDKGLEQAKLTAKYIKENYTVERIYSSDLKRAYNTAKCLADLVNLEIIKDKNLREIYAGKWEGMKCEEILAAYRDDYDVWLKHIGHAKCTDGETVKELGKRVMKALTQIAIENDGKNVVIVTHATPIRVTQSIIETGSTDKMEEIPWVSNASVTLIKYENGRWNVEEVSKDAHLQALRTELPKNV